MMLDLPGDRLVFKEKGKKVETVESKGGHSLVNLELVGKWEDSDAIYLVEKEDEVKSDKAIKKIIRRLTRYLMKLAIMMNLMNTLPYLKRRRYTRVPGALTQRATPLLYTKLTKSQC